MIVAILYSMELKVTHTNDALHQNARKKQILRYVTTLAWVCLCVFLTKKQTNQTQSN